MNDLEATVIDTSVKEEGLIEGTSLGKDAWKRLKVGNFYSPKKEAALIDTSRLFVVHVLDDRVIPVKPLRDWSKKQKFKPLILRTGGHFSTRKVMRPEIWKKVSAFLKTTSH